MNYNINSIAAKERAFLQDGIESVEKAPKGSANMEGVIFEKESRIASPRYGKNIFCGAYSYVNDGGYLRSNVFIGRFCSIGRRVTLAAGGHSHNGVSTHPLLMLSDGAHKTSTIIESDVWIGDGVVVMPGIRIGQGSIIGANAVVTKDIPPYTIAVGQPAKAIKNRFSLTKSELLTNSAIFERPITALRELNGLLLLEDSLFEKNFAAWLERTAEEWVTYDSYTI
tara:strand:+ start:3835 stop:4509 length:675 start_codon:yes stop_codon:yes gene_type:complete